MFFFVFFCTWLLIGGYRLWLANLDERLVQRMSVLSMEIYFVVDLLGTVIWLIKWLSAPPRCNTAARIMRLLCHDVGCVGVHVSTIRRKLLIGMTWSTWHRSSSRHCVEAYWFWVQKGLLACVFSDCCRTTMKSLYDCQYLSTQTTTQPSIPPGSVNEYQI